MTTILNQMAYRLGYHSYKHDEYCPYDSLDSRTEYWKRGFKEAMLEDRKKKREHKHQ